MRRTSIAVFLLCALCMAAVAAGQGETKAPAAARELTLYEGLWYNISVSVASLADTPLYREMEKRTGIKVTWIHPPQGQEGEHFNLMIASQELPDMIYGNWSSAGYPGGPEKAIGDGVITKINALVEKQAPNLMAHYKKHPDWLKASKTDSGTMYMFPWINGHQDLLVYFGPQLRKDWLDELKLQVPETLADWEKVLLAFKNGGKCQYPLTFTQLSDGRGMNAASAFIQPFRTTWEFYQDDAGKVHFGPYDPQFKDFLVFFKGWCDKGLVDPEIWSNARKTFDAKILNGDVGAWVSYTGSGIGAYLDANGGKGTFDIVPAKYPVRTKGETPFYGQRDNGVTSCGTAITTKARDPALAATWLDYSYGEEGSLLVNFGIEGESYTWVTDYPGYEGVKFPKYTDLVTKNPEGKTLAQMGGLYTRVFYEGSFVGDERHIYQYAWRPAQRDAIRIWGITEAEKHMFPAISATAQEAEDLAAIMAEVETYREEMVVKFITGQEPLDNFAAFQARLKQAGIERAIQIMQAELDRYKTR